VIETSQGLGSPGVGSEPGGRSEQPVGAGLDNR